MNTKISVLAAFIMLIPAALSAEMIAMRDFIKLKRGMSEGEVLYRVGNFDHESIYSDHYQVRKKIWYYIPEHIGSKSWITEITFDHTGTVSSLNRYRARK